MSAKAALRSLLVAAAGLDGVQVVGDVLPLNVAAPAIGLQTISAVDDRPIRRGPGRRVTERVQATWLAADATRREQLARAIKSAADGRYGAIAGLMAVAVRVDGRGPDFTTEGGLRGGSIDFLVSYSEAA